MKTNVCVITERENDWQVFVASTCQCIEKNLKASEFAVRLKEILDDASVPFAKCLVAPATTSCFFTVMKVDESVDVRDRTMLRYELENHLPIDAESTCADFVSLTDHSPFHVASIAIETDRLKQLVDALGDVGVDVVSIVPQALLIAHGYADSLDAEEPHHLIIVRGGRCDCIRISGSIVTAWKQIVWDPSSLYRYCQLEAGKNESITLLGLQGGLPNELKNRMKFVEGDLNEYLLSSAGRVAEQTWEGRFELRRDALAPPDPWVSVRSDLRWLAAAAGLFFFVVAAGAWWRSVQIDSRIADLRHDQTQRFRDSFPDSTPPAALLRRVRSEHQKALGSRRASGVDVPQSAPLVLQHFLSSVPKDVRYRITRLAITDGSVDCEFQVREIVDAGRIAEALSEAGFRVDPPSSRRMDSGGYGATLRAEVAS